MMSTSFRMDIRGPNRSKEKRANVTAACSACRAQKLACDAKRPRCSRCVRRKTGECVYATQSNRETRTQALKRQVQTLTGRLDTVARCLTSLRELPEDAVARMIVEVLATSDPVSALVEAGKRIEAQSSLLRQRMLAWSASGAVFPDIRSTLEYELHLRYPRAYPTIGMPEINLSGLFPDLEYSFAQQIAKKAQNLSGQGRLGFRHLPGTGQDDSSYALGIECWDDRLLQLDIRFWTTVPIDNGLAVRALSLYLMTDHALIGGFDADLFIADLVDHRSRFCSRPLVNAILAYACMKIAPFERAAGPISSALIAEARRLMIHNKPPSVLSAAAMRAMHTFFVFSGDINSAKIYLYRAITMCEHLHLFGRSQSRYALLKIHSEEEINMRGNVAWGIFGAAIFWGYRWGYIPPSLPSLPIPFSHAPTEDESPDDPSFGSFNPRTRRVEQVFVNVCRVLSIVHEVLTVFQNNPPFTQEATLSFVDSIYQKLLGQADAAANSFDQSKEMDDFVAIARIWWHSAVIDLFQPFLGVPHRLSGLSASDRSASMVFMASLTQLRHLVLLYRYNFSRSLTTPLWLYGPLYVTYAMVRNHEDPGSKFYFRLCLSVYLDLAISFPGIRGLLEGAARMGLKVDFISEEEIAAMLNVCEKARKRQAGEDEEDEMDRADSVAGESSNPQTLALREGFQRYFADMGA